MQQNKPKFVQCYGRKKTAVATTTIRQGRGHIFVKGNSMEFLQPQTPRIKAIKPLVHLLFRKFPYVDVKIRVKGGSRISRAHAANQSFLKALFAFYQRCLTQNQRKVVDELVAQHYRSLQASNPRAQQSQKEGAPGDKNQKPQ